MLFSIFKFFISILKLKLILIDSVYRLKKMNFLCQSINGQWPFVKFYTTTNYCRWMNRVEPFFLVKQKPLLEYGVLIKASIEQKCFPFFSTFSVVFSFIKKKNLVRYIKIGVYQITISVNYNYRDIRWRLCFEVTMLCHSDEDRMQDVRRFKVFMTHK